MLVETREQAKWRDEQEQADLSIALALSSAEVANAQQHTKPASHKTKPAAQRKKSSRSTQSSPTAAKARRNCRVTKQRLPETRTAQTAKSLIVKLPIKYYNIGPKMLRGKYGIKLKRERLFTRTRRGLSSGTTLVPELRCPIFLETTLYSYTTCWSTTTRNSGLGRSSVSRRMRHSREQS